MDFSLSPELAAFREEAAAFLDAEVPPERREPPLSDGDASGREEAHRALAAKLGAKGWLSRHWPREFGGRDASPLARLVLLEELARRGAPGYDAIGAGSVAPVLLLKGTDTQQRRHLPAIAAGSRMWCAALSEPGCGSDLASIEVAAREDGNAFVVDGRKTWVARGHAADWCILAARTDRETPGYRGLTCFLADMKTPGITANPIADMTGGRDLSEIRFESARIPKEDVIGGKGQGWYVMMALLDYARTAEAVYAAAAVLLEDIAAGGREHGLMDTLAEHRYAGLAADCEAARLLHYRATLLQGRGQPASSEAAQCRLFGAELAQRVADFGMELLGEQGQLTGDAAPLSGLVPYRWLRSAGVTLELGAPEMQREVIARRGLGLPQRR